MLRESLVIKVRTHAAEYFGVAFDDIAEDSFLVGDLGGDDLDVTQFIFELEDEFEVTLNDPEDDDAVTIKMLVDDLRQAIAARDSRAEEVARTD